MKLKLWAFLVSGLAAFGFPLSMAVLILTGQVMFVLENLCSFVVACIVAAVIFGCTRILVGEK